MLRVPPKFLELHSGNKPEEPIDAHAVQPYYTLLLAREAGMTISIHATAEEIVLTASERRLQVAGLRSCRSIGQRDAIAAAFSKTLPNRFSASLHVIG